MPDVIKTVSQLIESQFPDVYREEGPQLVAFVKAYFEYLETDEKSSLKMGRQLFEINDVDDTLNEFVVKYKEKYLADFPFISSTNNKFMIKHIIDYYRSKGSKQSLELLMKMLYGEDIEVYNPGQDVLRVSDSDWFEPQYLEISKSKRTAGFLDQQIRGSRSNATAFVEGVVTKRVNGKLIDLIYLSDVKGTFREGEFVSDDGQNRKAPRVLGSLSSIDIVLGGRDNKIGDVFDVVQNGAKQGKVRVTETQDATGRVDFKMSNGGSGYTLAAANGFNYTDVYVSDVVLDVKNPDLDFIRFEKIVQPVETLYLLSSSDVNENASIGDYVVGRNSSDELVANGVIIETANTFSNNDIIPAGTQAIGFATSATVFTIGENVTSGSKSGKITAAAGVELILELATNSDSFENTDVVTGAVSGETATVISSSPGTELKVLVTDQTFANQISVILDGAQDTRFRDGEIVNEESDVTIRVDTVSSRFAVGSTIKQVKALDTNFSAVETFLGNGTQTVFTHSANLENSDPVVVSVDGARQIENTNYTLSGSDLTFYANSVPSTPSDGANNVLISATNTVSRTVSIAEGTMTPNGTLDVLSGTNFSAGDEIVVLGTSNGADIVSVSNSAIVYENADTHFLPGDTITLAGDSNSNTTINTVDIDMVDVFGTFEEDSAIKQGSKTARIPAAGVLVTTQGARGVVQKDGSLGTDEIIVKDIFGAFTAGKLLKGDKSRIKETIVSTSITGADYITLNGVASTNGAVDIVSNNYVTGVLVGQNTSSIGVKIDNLSTMKFKTANTGLFTINTSRNEFVTPPKFSISDLTFNMEHDVEFLEGEVISLEDPTKSRRVVLESFVIFPNPLADGILWEVGGRDFGTSLSIITDGADKILRLRSGDGDPAKSTTQNYLAVIDVAASNIPTDKNVHVVVVYINPNNGNIRLWIDGVSKGNQTASNGKLGDSSGKWTGTGIGGYGEGIDDVAGYASGAALPEWSGEISSTLKLFDNSSANTSSVSGTVIDLIGEKVYDQSTGSSATFDIEKLENTDTYTLNTDFPYLNNYANNQYLDIKISGEGSGIGYVDTFTITNGGTGYSVNTPITLSGGGLGAGNPLVPAEAQITGVDINGTITQITVTTDGEGYYETPSFTLPDNGVGTDATIEIVMDFGYGFPKAPDADKDNMLIDALTFDDFTIGNIVTLGSINPGAGYNRDPFVVVYNKYIASYRRGNFAVEVSGVSGSFRNGELITQTVGGESFSKGKVISYDITSRSLLVERTSFETGFADGVQISGSRSGATADIVSVGAIEDQNVMGDNAVVVGDVIAANGIATAVQVIDSGYGYSTNGSITLESEDTPFIITGTSTSKQQGVGEGYWRSTTSHLNSEKKLHDNKYYQEFSYEVLSGLALRRYENVLKRVLHVAGTELFGAVVKRSDIALDLTTPSGNSSITAE